jgi:2-hydroxychromene-2-carboxylate isomerase
MEAMAAPVRFFFDYVSPYSYLAWTQLPALAARCGREVEPVPVLFAALLQAHGTRGPAEVRAKRSYVFKHTSRLAHALGVPFSPPPTHPFNPLLALRVTSLPLAPQLKHRVVDALFAAVWAGGGGVEGPEQVAAVLGAAGLDAPALLAAAGAPEAKARLRLSTEEALAAGAFGVPSYLADGELLFGVDSLGHLEDCLRGRDPLQPEALARWRDLPASAVRREGGGPGPNAFQGVSEAEARAFAERWLPAWTGNDPERLVGFYTEDALYLDPQVPEGLRGREALLGYFRRLLRRNPAWVWTQRSAVPMEGGFVNLWRARIPSAEGESVLDGACLVWLRDGRISRNEVFFLSAPGAAPARPG